MDKMRVAVFPAGSEIGLEICNALKYDKAVELYGLTSVEDHSQMVFERVHCVPFYTDENFLDKLNLFLREHQIDFLYPAYDDILLFLTRNQDKICANVVTSALETIEITRSKKKTYEFLKQEDFIPRVYENVDEIKFYPVFVKPDIGQGSCGVCKIEAPEEFSKVNDLEKNVICEYLPGEEVTVDCFTDGSGQLLSYIPRTRSRIRNGIAVRSEVVESTEEIGRIAYRLNTRLEFKGAWFFQLKRDINNQYKLLEIAARVPGTMGLTRNLGINYPMLTLYVQQGMSVEICKNNYSILVDRALISRYQIQMDYQHVYVDLDDTLIVENKVNGILMNFIYQCLNKGKKIYLLTRHKGDVAEYLQQYKIAEALFEKIFVLKDEEKAEYILSENAIFIDDSFRERKGVKNHCNIPVFGVENIESLIEWK